MSKVINKRRKKKNVSKVPNGVVYIGTTFNNIIITVTDMFGNALVSSSAGGRGFKGAKKSTPFAAQIVADSVAREAQELFSLKTIAIIVRGPGAGRESAIRALGSSGLIVTVIKDVTPLPHNGCRMPRRRRV
ncbi:MAG: 30S ribosomal protein S11 [Alphaproteobacteria bacterium]|nr:30S ribosomal protein S11 [Rickettsiales bacterium]